MSIESRDRRLAARLDALTVDPDAGRMGRMMRAVELTLDAQPLAFKLPGYFIPVSVMGAASAGVLGVLVGSLLDNGTLFGGSVASLVLQFTVGIS